MKNYQINFHAPETDFSDFWANLHTFVLLSCTTQSSVITQQVDSTARLILPSACHLFNWKRITGIKLHNPMNFCLHVAAALLQDCLYARFTIKYVNSADFQIFNSPQTCHVEIYKWNPINNVIYILFLSPACGVIPLLKWRIICCPFPKPLDTKWTWWLIA